MCGFVHVILGKLHGCLRHSGIGDRSTFWNSCATGSIKMTKIILLLIWYYVQRLNQHLILVDGKVLWLQLVKRFWQKSLASKLIAAPFWQCLPAIFHIVLSGSVVSGSHASFYGNGMHRCSDRLDSSDLLPHLASHVWTKCFHCFAFFYLLATSVWHWTSIFTFISGGEKTPEGHKLSAVLVEGVWELTNIGGSSARIYSKALSSLLVSTCSAMRFILRNTALANNSPLHESAGGTRRSYSKFFNVRISIHFSTRI